MKFHRLRDTRHKTGDRTEGLRMSITIEADSAEEADKIFEERWEQRQRTDAFYLADRLPLLDHERLRAEFLSPFAMELKRATPMFTSP